MRHRVHWIDVLKGIGIFLVIMGHTIKDTYVYNWIYSFHMPLFFFLSGFLIEQKPKIDSYKIFLLQKCKSLLLPFIVFRILLVIYWIVIESKYRELDLGPIWFLIVLFFNEIIIAPILLKYRKIWQSILCTSFCCIAFLTLKNIDFSFLYNYSFSWLLKTIPGWSLRILNAGIWFSGGFLLHKLIKYMPKNQIFIYLSLFICLGLSLLLSNLNPDVSMYCSTVGDFKLYLLLAISGICALFLISKYFIKQCHWIEWIGNYTIVILAIHEPIKRIILKLCELSTHISISTLQNNFWIALFICFLILIGCIPVIWLFKWIKTHSGNTGNFILTFIK